jgi:hypothetical protein
MAIATATVLADVPQLPRLIVPSWRELPSGLLVPSSVADRVATAEGDEAARIPAELRGEPAPVAVVDTFPTSADQVAGALNEEELGLDASTLDQLVDLVRHLPFERSFLLVSRLAAALTDVREDAEAQVELVQRWEVPGLAEAIERVLRQHEAEGRRLVIFAEQYLTALQRLLIEHAAELDMEYEPTQVDLARTIRAIFAAASVTSAADGDLQEGDPDAERWLVYLLKNGLYNAQPPLVNEITRARELFAVLAPTFEHADFCPIDEWFREDYGLTAAEQHTAGVAASALANAFDDDAAIGDRSLTAPPEWRGELASKGEQIAAVLSAPRDWYVQAFGELGDGPAAIAWERRPFLRRPFIRYGNGQWLLIAPRMIASWLGEGVLHRVLETAQRRNASLQASRFVGALFERYCLDLTRSAYAGDRPAGGGRVHGEQEYGGRRRQLTSDIAIDLGTDLVLVEVVSARLTAQMRVFGDRELLERNLERMLFKKMIQLARVTRDLISEDAAIPDVDMGHVERIWPVLVTAGELMQTEMLWDQIDARLPQSLRAARVEPLSVFDIGDFELLLALVVAGHHLPDVLGRKAQGPYRRLEIGRFAVDELRADPDARLPVLDERYNELWQEMLAVLGFEAPEDGEGVA